MIGYYLIFAQLQLQHIFTIIPGFAQAVATCPVKQDFFGFPTWYKYLKGNQTTIDSITGGPPIVSCAPALGSLQDVWLIVLAVIELLLRVVILLAIFYIVFAGIKYIDSRGNAEKLNSAKHTALDALKGLVIAIVATALVSFVAGIFK